MIQHDRPNPEFEFDEALRRYANRTPRTSPKQASLRIAEQIRHFESPLRAGWMLTAAAGLLLAAVGATIVWRSPRAIPPETEMLAIGGQPLSQGEVLLWIDDKTPLYMTFQPPEASPDPGASGNGAKP